MKSIWLTVMAMFYFGTSVFADSPLTSTPFYKAYTKAPVMKQVSKANGILSEAMIEYFLGSQNPIALKLSIINRLGWDIQGKENAAIFLNHVFSRGLYRNIEDFKNRGTWQELICFAYLKAMDQYQDVNACIPFAEAAMHQSPNNLSVQIIAGLIKAQTLIYDMERWGDIYSLLNEIEVNKSTNADLNRKALRIIHSYTDNYKKYLITDNK